MTKHTPESGHKFTGAQMGFKSSCECGWSSAVWFGKGSRASAIGEWHSHVSKCAKLRGED